MSNPYADTPLWARYYSEQMGWPVTEAVLNAADGPMTCDACGARETDDLGDWDSERKTWQTIRRTLVLDRDYCFGCGMVICDDCVPPGYGKHSQDAHVAGVAHR